MRSEKIAGKMIINGTNLTGRSDPIHVAENNVIYLRHGASDKLQTVDETMIQKYSINEMEISDNE